MSADLTRNQTSGADDQPFVDHEITLETATYFGILDRGVAVEEAGFSDDHVAAFLQISLDMPLDHEPVALVDLTR